VLEASGGKPIFLKRKCGCGEEALAGKKTLRKGVVCIGKGSRESHRMGYEGGAVVI